MAAKKNNMGVKDRLMKKNLTQLKAQAKKLKLKGFSTKKKNDLVKSIMMAEARNKKSKTPMRGNKSVKRISKKRGARPNLPMRTPVQMRGRRNMGMSEYNGWTNYESWWINLHFGDYFQELYEELRLDGDYDFIYYSDLFEEVTEEQLIDNVYGLSKDIIVIFLSEVNYREIAKAITEE